MTHEILGGYLTNFSSNFIMCIVHAAILFSVIVLIQNCFCFLCSPIISGGGKILPPLIQKSPLLGWKIKKKCLIVDFDSSKEGF